MRLPVAIPRQALAIGAAGADGTGATAAVSAMSWLGGGQRPTARQREQLRGRPGDTMATLAVELASWGGQGANPGDLGLADNGDLDASWAAFVSHAVLWRWLGPGRRLVACSRLGPAAAQPVACPGVRSATRRSRWSTSSLTSQDARSWRAADTSVPAGAVTCRQSSPPRPAPGASGGAPSRAARRGQGWAPYRVLVQLAASRVYG
jgi:hypothetical protein